jgi:RNase P subunit RPR2
MTEEHQRYFLAKRDKATFYCPNGHSQCYTGLSDKEKLEQERARHQETLARLNVAEAKRVQLEKRIKRGVCPCCKRSFTALARHIKSKHPEYAETK